MADHRKDASIVLCHPEQSFFCANMTHYSRCIHLDFTSVLDTSLTVLQESEFYCGAHRCCQAGATIPCTYHCQRSTLDFENPQMPWNFVHLRKRKKERSKLPLTSQEVDRLDKIVSVKSFIIRQKDLKDWDDENSVYDDDDENDYEDNIYKWKPSYRTFCPLNEAKARASDIRPPPHCGYTPSTTNTITPRTTTNKPPIITTKLATTKPTTVTTKSTTTQPRIITIKPTTTKPTRTTTKPTTKSTEITTRSTTTNRQLQQQESLLLQERQHQNGQLQKKITKRAKTKKTTKRKKNQARTKHLLNKILPDIPCTASRLRWKLQIKGTCTDYTECSKKETKSKNVIYEWEIKSCNKFQLFSKKHQECRKLETVPCNINAVENLNPSEIVD